MKPCPLKPVLETWLSRLKTACPVLAIAAFTLAASFPRASLHAQDKRPNVILIICDDLNDYVEGFGGHPQARTPGISRLSKSGVSVTQAHCNIPTCESSCLTPLFCNAAARSPARRTTSAIEPRLNASSPSSSSSPRTSTMSMSGPRKSSMPQRRLSLPGNGSGMVSTPCRKARSSSREPGCRRSARAGNRQPAGSKEPE